MSEPARVLNIFMVLDRGGAETFVMNVYRNIDRTAVQFDFLVHGDKVGAYEEEILSLGGRIYRLPEMTDFFAYKKAVREFFDGHKEYRIVHSHASELGLFVLKEAKRRSVPCRICHAHSAPKGFGPKTPVRWFFKRRTNRYANGFFACSESAGIWQFGKKCGFTVIKNGIKTDDFIFREDDRKRIREQLGVDGKLVLGHVGRMEKPKNHGFLISVFEEVCKRTDAALLLIGDGSQREALTGAVKAAGLEDRVLFLGTRENVAEYLSAMDVFVFPSLFEGLGIVLIEAQANGLSCFASDRIPREAIVTDLAETVSLDSACGEWADRISGAEKAKDRASYCRAVKDAGYDIVHTVDTLTEFYRKYF